MSTNGLEVFDKTIQTTHIWLDEIRDALGADRHLAWHALGVVLRTLRDRLPVELCAHLGAELPMMVRGVYYDQFRPGAQPQPCRTLGEFYEHVERGMRQVRPIDPQDATAAVFAVLSRHIPHGQLTKVRDALASELRAFWISVERGEAAVGLRAAAPIELRP
jgi:uncharacterized protein (DUF2267 family)